MRQIDGRFLLSRLSLIFGKTAGECIVFGTLSLSVFTVGPLLVRKESLLYFNTGQPLGYYGSWALFSLSHHYLVWLAAWIVHPQRRVPFSIRYRSSLTFPLLVKWVGRALFDEEKLSIFIPNSFLIDSGRS